MIAAEPATRTARKTGTPPAPSDSSPRIAYLLSQYPARSHTFFLNEILGLRARGLHIEAASINAPDRAAHDLSPQEAREAHDTFYVKQGSRLAAFARVAATALGRPALVLRGLRAIATLPSLTLRQRGFWLFYLAEAILVGRWMQRRNLPHLHVHFGGAVASVGMLTSVCFGIPYSLTVHGPEELLDPAGYQLAAKLRQASFVLCISDFCRNQLLTLAPSADWAKFTVIRLGVDPAALSPALFRNRDAADTCKLVCVGRLVEAKGHRILLHALALLQQRGIAVHTTLIGAGPLEAELRRYVEEQQIAQAVTFTSGLSHTETLAHVRRADIFALASFAEGVPVALMEAMSLEVPCVSTTVAGIPELIRTGTSGLLVPPGDTSALAEALASLLGNAALRRRLGTAGRQQVLAEYNLPLNLERLSRHLRKCLAEPLPRPSVFKRRTALRQT